MSQQPIGNNNIQEIIKRLLDDSLDLDFLAVWLMLVGYFSLLSDDLNHFILALRDSGDTYDYRDSPELENAKVIRRYPTGALSEKMSLIMPSIMAAAADTYSIVSPFLVGRALSFTGGTWDKFKAIPNFQFPLPGEESIQAMQNCKIAMSVTNGNYNPADRHLYQFRSVTGTVPSIDLIVASIASKMLACPADHLLMDIRYGDGAFMTTEERAEELGNSLAKVLNNNGAPCSFLTISTEQPNGCAIGHCFEVIEAIAIMTGKYDEIWDKEALQTQKDLVLKFFANLMHTQYQDKDLHYWHQLGLELFENGQVFKSFLHLLKHHSVDEETIKGICTDPWSTLAPRTAPIYINAKDSGVLKEIKQKQLGNLVNFKFGAGANEFAGEFSTRAGVVLQKRLKHRVEKNETLCQVFFNKSMLDTLDKEEIISEFQDCFVIE